MANALQYIVDEKGQKTSVVVPIKTWEKMTHENSRLKSKIKILTGIRDGLNEVKEAKKSGKKLQTAKEFLIENQSPARKF
jgi:hypothetical protein